MSTGSDAKKAIFETMPVPRALASLTIPTIISQLITLVYNLADAYFVGLTGNAYMIGAVSLVYPVFSMTIALANLFGVGGGNLISRLLGVQRQREAKKVCMFSFYAAICVSLLFSAVVGVSLVPLLRALGASADTMPYARQYMLLVVVAGTLPTVLSATMGHLLRSVGYAKKASIGLSMGAVLNIILDPIFMFALLPAGREVIGAALATMTANAIASLYFLGVIAKLQRSTALCLSPKIGMPEKKTVAAVFSIGLPSALTVLFYDITNICLNARMAAYGDYQLAALGIVIKAERLPLNTGVGICLGMMPLVAYNDTAGNHKRMYAFIRTARIAGLIVAAVSILLYETCTGEIVRLFFNASASDPTAAAETLRYGILFLHFRCLASPFAFMNFHITYTLQALGEGRTTLLLAALRQCGFYLPILFLMDAVVGQLGLVWTQTIAEIVTLLIAFYVFRRKVAQHTA